jgi:hypothetical protein
MAIRHTQLPTGSSNGNTTLYFRATSIYTINSSISGHKDGSLYSISGGMISNATRKTCSFKVFDAKMLMKRNWRTHFDYLHGITDINMFSTVLFMFYVLCMHIAKVPMNMIVTMQPVYIHVWCSAELR